jgi:hypothetical protein
MLSYLLRKFLRLISIAIGFYLDYVRHTGRDRGQQGFDQNHRDFFEKSLSFTLVCKVTQMTSSSGAEVEQRPL